MLAPLALISAAAFAAPAVSDTELSGMRGGFSLPGGLEATMAVRTETSVNGGLLLRSIYRIDQGPPTLQLYAPAVGQTVRAQTAGASTLGQGTQGAVRINFDRQNGVSISRQMGMPATSVTVGLANQASEAASDNLQPLDLSSGSVETAGGRVSVSDLPQGVRARIQGDGIDASHLFGAAFGSVVANTANDRAIESATTISLDLRGATPMNLGSSMLRAEGIAADAVRQMVIR